MTIKERNIRVEDMLAEMKHNQEVVDALQEALIERARHQERLEILYNALAQLAREGIEFLEHLRVGDQLDDQWIARRDELLARAISQIQKPSS